MSALIISMLLWRLWVCNLTAHPRLLYKQLIQALKLYFARVLIQDDHISFLPDLKGSDCPFYTDILSRNDSDAPQRGLKVNTLVFAEHLAGYFNFGKLRLLILSKRPDLLQNGNLGATSIAN